MKLIFHVGLIFVGLVLLAKPLLAKNHPVVIHDLTSSAFGQRLTIQNKDIYYRVVIDDSFGVDYHQENGLPLNSDDQGISIQIKITVDLCYGNTTLNAFVSTAAAFPTSETNNLFSFVVTEGNSQMIWTASVNDSTIFPLVYYIGLHATNDIQNNPLGMIPFTIVSLVQSINVSLPQPLLPGDCGAIRYLYVPKDTDTIQLTFQRAQSPDQSSPHRSFYSLCSAPNSDIIDKMDLSPTSDIFNLPDVLCTEFIEGTNYLDLTHPMTLRGQVTSFTVIVQGENKLKSRYNLFTFERQTPQPLNSTLRHFFVGIHLVAIIITSLWIIVHALRHRVVFKFYHITKTSFPTSFVIPADLKSTRVILMLVAAVHIFCAFATIPLGLVSLLFIVTPFFALAGSILYSPLLIFFYMLCSATCVGVCSHFIIAGAFQVCTSNNFYRQEFCTSVSLLGTILYLLAILILLLFLLLAYSFNYKLLRYKYWLSSQAILNERKDFEYQKLRNEYY